MKKNDLILIAVLLTAALILYGFMRWQSDDGGYIRVTVDGEVYGDYSLRESIEIPIDTGNLLQIENGTAAMTWADCPDQLCVHQKQISETGEMIICLPNRVIAEVISEKGAADEK